MQDQDKNSYVGIGVTMSRAEGSEYQISKVSKGGPAEKAGILPLDVLDSVDGTKVRDFASYEDMIAAVRGEDGTVVKIAVMRDG